MTANPNDRQVGGTHYNQVDVQHWDLVLQNRLPYLEAQCTKYITRWKKKGQGVQDVEKSGHYLDKLIASIESGFLPLPTATTTSACSIRVPITNLEEFASQNKIGEIEKTIFLLILTYTTLDELMRVRILLAHLLQMAQEHDAAVMVH